MQISGEKVSEMGRSLGELQRELEVMRERAEDREKRAELSLEELETLIAAKDEDTNRKFQEQAQKNAEAINKVNSPKNVSAPCYCQLKGSGSNESEFPRG